jgi:hypothetical protein
MDLAARQQMIRELCSFEGRATGTDAERRAANRLAERVRGLGRRAEVQPIHVHPQAGLITALHCLVGFAGSLIAIEVPALGFGLVLAAAVSLYLDLHYRFYLLRRLFFRRASQNVVSPGKRRDAPARLILSAHLDAGRSGAIHSPRRARLAARLGQRFPSLGPFRLVFWSLAALLPLCAARMAGVESEVISVLQLLPTLALLLGMFAGVESELSPVVPGANDNASGVATAVSLAAELDSDPPRNLDVWLVLDGGEESQQEGMRAFVRAHRKRFDHEHTYFIDLTTLGQGDVRFETAAGWIVGYGMDRRLVELAAAIAESDAADENRYRALPLRHGSAGDSMPPRLAGFRSIGITCRNRDGYVPHRHQPSDLPDAIDEAALERAHDFALELIRALDRDVGRSARAGEPDKVAT